MTLSPVFICIKQCPITVSYRLSRGEHIHKAKQWILRLVLQKGKTQILQFDKVMELPVKGGYISHQRIEHTKNFFPFAYRYKQKELISN